MSPTFSIAPACRPQDVRAVADLFRAYAASLPVDLGYQSFEAELAGLPGKYAPPEGLLLLASDGNRRAAGCVALRTLAPQVGELKRLYAEPWARGSGLGRALAEAAVSAARAFGWRELRLDTLPSMERAAALYARLGFEPCEPYYAPTPEGTRFMRLPLR